LIKGYLTGSSVLDMQMYFYLQVAGRFVEYFTTLYQRLFYRGRRWGDHLRPVWKDFRQMAVAYFSLLLRILSDWKNFEPVVFRIEVSIVTTTPNCSV